MAMFQDIFSPKTSVPMRIAVSGSNTPITEAFVAPMIFVDAARVAVEMTVGMTARRMRFIHIEAWLLRSRKSPLMDIFPILLPMNAMAPKTMHPTASE